MKRIFSILLVIIAASSALSGCWKGQDNQLANELEFSLDGITSITISYDEEPITFFENDSDTLIIREYMTKNINSYHAKVKRQSESIQISEGGKPLYKKSFGRHVEVYLPVSYSQNLAVSSTSGMIDFSETFFNLSLLRVDTTSGSVLMGDASAKEIYFSLTSGELNAGKLCADTIHLETTSGSIQCRVLDGKVTYVSTSGNLEVQSAIGSGHYRANNAGVLNVIYTKVAGDLFFYNKNDAVAIVLPKDLQFLFEATTKNGLVTTNFEQSLTTHERTTKGAVGGNPAVTVTVETNNGNIEVRQ